jgi:hypothetical protein
MIADRARTKRTRGKALVGGAAKGRRRPARKTERARDPAPPRVRLRMTDLLRELYARIRREIDESDES